jgi:hypothetical protein
MLVCPGCHGRNPAESEVCAFCHLRLDNQAQTHAPTEPRPRRIGGLVLATVLLAVLLSVVLLVLARSTFIA